ncbi:MAG: hypothetical protein O2968_03725 [Acidobacteria bacterium]|nr:hypothetical protein [Acidobacteriota bacterium]
MKSPLDFSLDARPSGIHDLATGMEYNFITVRQITPETANRFPQPTFDLVPDNSLANGPRYGETDPARFRFVDVPNERRKERASDAAALLINPLELGSFSKTLGLGETLRSSGFGLSIIRS